MTHQNRSGTTNSFYLMLGAAIGILFVLGIILYFMGKPSAPTSSGSSDGLFLYCAAGMRLPVEQIVADYEEEYGVAVQLQYGGSNTLLSQIELAKTGDLYLAADDSYMELAREKGLTQEILPLSVMHPVAQLRVMPWKWATWVLPVQAWPSGWFRADSPRIQAV